MSVLIGGMEMPKDCVHCSLLEGSTDDGLCHAANKWMDDEYFRWYQYPEGDLDDSKPLNCPLVPFPAGHGRLIDADAFKADCLAATTDKTWKYFVTHWMPLPEPPKDGWTDE
jgi:hypothetical protein